MVKIDRKLSAFWQFSRPHTVVGTSLSAIALFAMAFARNYPEVQFFTSLPILMWATIACLCGNVYIVGLNQLEDIAIDKINKPYLPLASGELSLRAGRAIVLATGAMAVAIALFQGIWLSFTVIVSLIIGTAYSLPPIRLKRFPLWASVCVFVVRGAVVNLGLWLHFEGRLGRSLALRPTIPNEIWGLTVFVLIFTYVIAIFKDMPDTEGDRQFHIATLSIRLGQAAVFNLSRQILVCLYAIFIGLSFSPLLTGTNAFVIAVSHSILAIAMWWRSLQVDLRDRTSITDFYQFIWRLFYIEYIVFPVACILA